MGLKNYIKKSRDVLRSDGFAALAKKVATHINEKPSDVEGSDTSSNTCDVLFVNGCDTSVPHPARYRVKHQIEQLSFWGRTCDEVFYMDVVSQDAQRCKVIILFRCPITDAIEALIDAAHTSGVKVYFDIDDLVIDTCYTDSLPVVKSMSKEDKRIFDDGVTRNGKTLSLCDGAIVSTTRLKTELSKIVPDVFINRNVASMEMLELSKAASTEAKNRYDVKVSDEEVTIGYFSGSMTHDVDFAEVAQALEDVLEMRENAVLVVCGDLDMPQGLKRFSDRVRHCEKVDWRELPRLIASVDICLAPLENTIFNEAKSENKWVEASLVKVPTIASNVGAFADMVENGETGFLCTDANDWKRSLLALIDDSALRCAMGNKAYEYCLQNCITAATGYKLSSWLFGGGTKISDITPVNEQAKKEWIESFSGVKKCQTSNTPIDNTPWQSSALEGRLNGLQTAFEGGMKTALFIYERNCGDDATFRYFGYNVVQRLRLSDTWSGQFLFVDEIDVIKNSLPESSAVVLIRCRIRPEIVELVNFAHRFGVPVAYAMDDDALGAKMAPRVIKAMASDPNSQFETDFWKGVANRFEACALMCDCFIASSTFFADVLSKRYERDSYVIRQSLNDEQVAISSEATNEPSSSHASPKGFVMGYFSGTASHQEDFALVRDAVLAHLQKHPQSILLLAGEFELDAELYAMFLDGRVRVIPRVDYQTLQRLQACVDVVLAPLVLDEFSNCKGALKVFEAGVVFTPACASPSFSYKEAIEHGVTGFICNNSTDWQDALDALCNNPEMCSKMGEASYNKAMAERYGDAVLHEIETALEGIAQTAKLQPSISELPKDFDEITDWDDPFVVNPMFSDFDARAFIAGKA